ncbi:MAG TPA: M10 family metallopeptidase [Sphingomicrobium sp.]|nr:M10 family metallopeptidase [Sphingomicrobium sp.]
MVDIPDNETTSETISVGETLINAIDTVGDHDWVAIHLTAGQEITVSLSGLTLDDPFLQIRNQAGNVIPGLTSDDINLGVNLDSLLSFKASYTGVYYIDVGAYQNPDDPNDPYPGSTGDYQLEVTPYQTPPVWTNDQIAEQLTSGYWGDGIHQFVLDGSRTLTFDVTGLTEAGKNLAREALQTWSEITGITFVETSSTSASITFTDDDPFGGAFTESTYSGADITSSHVNVDADWLQQYGSTIGGYAYQAYLHEIGHALGLGHTGNYNTSAEYPYDALYQNDAWSTSVMSYFSQTDNGYFDGQGFTDAYLVTPMAADILAVQQLYGLASTTRSGNTTYGYNSNAGSPYDASVLTNVAYTIFDTGGTDTLDYSGYAGAQLIDLMPEAFSNVLGEIGNVTIARGTVIENAIGGSGNDTILGNSVANILRGNGGADTLNGLGGNDTLIGGNGNDIAYGGLGDDTIRVEQAGDRAVEAVGQGFDTVLATVSYALETGSEIDQLRALDANGTTALNFTGNEFAQKIVGNAGKNILAGNGGNDKLYGLGGNDSLSGGNGNDFMYGGLGNDTYRVDQAGDRVIEAVGEGTDIVKATVSYTLTAGSAVEQLRAFNTSSTAAMNLSGNEFGQTILGNAGSNILKGFAGNDTLSGGLGNDLLYGGLGNDTFRVDQAGDRVIEAAGEGIDIVKATVSFSLEAGSEIEQLRAYDTASTTALNLSGNEFGQTMIGNAANNVLRGFGGDDTLSGGGGNDTLYGGTGNDTYRVDQRDDRVIEAVGEGTDVIRATVSFAIVAGSEVEELRVYDTSSTTVVNLYGNEFGQKLVGNEGSNLLSGLGGNDRLYGLGGNDQLDGGTGNNILTGGAGVDRFLFSNVGTHDTIIDFTTGEKIDLRGMDANAGLAGDQAFSWIGGNDFSGTAGELRTYVDNGVNYLVGDVNGDGVADFLINVGTHQVVTPDILF